MLNLCERDEESRWSGSDQNSTLQFGVCCLWLLRRAGTLVKEGRHSEGGCLGSGAYGVCLLEGGGH